MALTHSRPFEAHVFDESPWYAPLACLTARLRGLDDFPTPEQLSALYAERTAGSDAAPLRFVAAAPRARRRGRRPVELASLYEGRIVLAGEVPTRLADWHDLFNALAFCAFPRAKWALHARQYRIYEARLLPGATRMPGARTREQDALALFDEGGVVICSRQPRAALPADPDRVDTALTELVRAGEARAWLFGHALFEHLAAGLPPPLGYAHVLELPALLDAPHGALAHPGARAAAQLAELDAIDRALAAALADPREFAEPERARGLSLPALAAEAL